MYPNRETASTGVAQPQGREPGYPSLVRAASGGTLRRLTRALVLATGTLLAIYGLAAVGVARFGSLDATAAYLGGDRLLVSPAHASFGKGRVGESRQVTFTVYNLTGRPVKIIGASSNCTCTAVKGLPLDVPAGSKLDLIVDVAPEARISGVEQRLAFLTDYTDAPALAVKISGYVVR